MDYSFYNPMARHGVAEVRKKCAEYTTLEDVMFVLKQIYEWKIFSLWRSANPDEEMPTDGYILTCAYVQSWIDKETYNRWKGFVPFTTIKENPNLDLGLIKKWFCKSK